MKNKIAKRNGHINSVADLTPDPKNIRRHQSFNLKTLEDSLHTVGAARSIVIDEDGKILAGNGLVEAAVNAGIERVKVVDGDGETIIAVRRSGLSERDKKRLAWYDNYASDTSAYDYDAALLAQLAGEDELVKKLAQEDYRLRALLSNGEPIDFEQEWQGMPEFEQKDLSAWESITVHFDSPENMKNFGELVEQTITEKTRSIWYPKKERADLKALVAHEQS